MTEVFSTEGEYAVNVPPSVLNAMKNRRSGEGPQASQGSNGKVFSVRYGFRPDSLDTGAPFQLTRGEGVKSEDFLIEAPGAHGSEPHLFRGQATSAKDNEYVLVFNQSTKSFDLQLLDFTLRMNASREKPSTRKQLSLPPREGSSTPVGTPVTSTPAGASNSFSEKASKPDEPQRVTRAPSGAKASSSPMPETSSLPKKPKAKRKPKTESKPVANVSADDDGDDDDLMGLADELEESLEDEGSAEANNNESKSDNTSDEDEDMGNNVMVLEPIPSARQTPMSAFSSPALGTPRGSGPISLRGYVGNRPEEDDLSSSEEE
uniref:ARAD1D37026p n=1 Tax=Blastobotrys adeninivorans TaxID=409370 RepID=A0A060TCL4_BLAAD